MGSFLQVILCMQVPAWFARSGAIIVLFSVWSTYITTPSISKETEVDFVESYVSARDNVPPKKSSWVKIYEVPKVIYIFELLAIVGGTIIWAYGDTWLVNCVTTHS